MTTSATHSGRIIGITVGLGLVMVLATVLVGAFLAAPLSTAHANTPLKAATGSTQQWAFGGNASVAYSCANSACFGGKSSPDSSFSLNLDYNIQWVVIYTQTNISSTQTQIEGQAALSASASFKVTECVVEGSGPCQSASLSLTLAGKEVALGFTNITTGSVNLTPSGGGPAGNVPALAIMNAASSDSFNFSGSYSAQTPTASGNANFDLGGAESSSVDFPTPLGIVPLNPAPGDTWNASAPFTATGTYSSGYSFSYNINGTSASSANWTSGAVSPSGTLSVNGTDLGAFTLWDNYTNPPTSVTAQEIVLDFGNGAFAASNGWVMVPSGLFSGLSLSGVDLATPQSPILISGDHPSGTSGVTGGESAYYEQNVGFIGASETGNTSVLGSESSGALTPSISLKAGPEPVSVAENQYQGIVSPTGSSGYPLTDLIIVVVVVVLVVVVVVAVVMRSRSARRRQPPAAAPPGTDMTGAPPGYLPPPPPPS